MEKNLLNDSTSQQEQEEVEEREGETLEAPDEEEPLEEELEEELVSSEKIAAIKEKNKHLFIRAKKAEEKARRFEAELFAIRQQEKKKETPTLVSPDIADLVKKISVLRDFSPEELDYISLISKAKNIPMEEAVKTPEVNLYIQARREKVEKESKVPKPSTKQAPSVKEYSDWTDGDVRKASIEELEKFRAWMKSYGRKGYE